MYHQDSNNFLIRFLWELEKHYYFIIKIVTNETPLFFFLPSGLLLPSSSHLYTHPLPTPPTKGHKSYCVFCVRFEGHCERTHTFFSAQILVLLSRKGLLPAILRFSTVSETDRVAFSDGAKACTEPDHPNFFWYIIYNSNIH